PSAVFLLLLCSDLVVLLVCPVSFCQCSGHRRALHSFLHDALPISRLQSSRGCAGPDTLCCCDKRLRWACRSSRSPSGGGRDRWEDRKSTRLNSSHVKISYAVFCLKKKKLRKPGGDENASEARRRQR